MYSRIVPETSMLARPLMSPAALPQPALGAEAPVPPLALPPLELLGEPAPPEAPPPPAAKGLPALLPEPPVGIPAAFVCPAAAVDVPPDPGAPPLCSLEAPAV